jgi:hypothetical protein
MPAMFSMSLPATHKRVEQRIIEGKVMENMAGMEDHEAVQVTTSLKWLTGLLSGPRGMLVST